jgi:hypothetical protein
VCRYDGTILRKNQINICNRKKKIVIEVFNGGVPPRVEEGLVIHKLQLTR